MVEPAGIRIGLASEAVILLRVKLGLQLGTCRRLPSLRPFEQKPVAAFTVAQPMGDASYRCRAGSRQLADPTIGEPFLNQLGNLPAFRHRLQFTQSAKVAEKERNLIRPIEQCHRIEKVPEVLILSQRSFHRVKTIPRTPQSVQITTFRLGDPFA